MKWQVFLIVFLFFTNTFASPLKKLPEKPKLLVVLVIDQLRADYLTRFESRFLPAKTPKGVGGFNFLTSEGAYFPFAEYDVLQSMTCPGHAMILTGSTPAMNGIILNEWFDSSKKKSTYCAEDEKHDLSPKNLKTTTLGDELKNAGYKSRVVGLALKDRSAIMLAGHRADHVFWFDGNSNQWTTSSYYSPDKSLPSWVSDENKKIQASIGKDYVWESKAKTTGLTENSNGPFRMAVKIGGKEFLALPYGVDITLQLAKSAINTMKLGSSEGYDILAVSLSSHDMLGHQFGPNSREMEEMIVAEDRALSDFFNFLNTQGLLKKSMFVLTSDHGVAPTVEYTKAAKINSGKIDYLDLFKKFNSYFDKKYGRPKNNVWVTSYLNLNFYFDRDSLSEKKLSVAEAAKEVKAILSDAEGVGFVATAADLSGASDIPQELLAQLKRQYDSKSSGDFIVIPKPFFFTGKETKANHITGFSYDRSVPLVILGPAIKKGVYSRHAKITEIAPTLSFVYGILPPATSYESPLDIF